MLRCTVHVSSRLPSTYLTAVLLFIGFKLTGRVPDFLFRALFNVRVVTE